MITATCDKPKWKDAQELKNAVYEWCDRIQVKVKQIQLRPMKQNGHLFLLRGA